MGDYDAMLTAENTADSLNHHLWQANGQFRGLKNKNTLSIKLSLCVTVSAGHLSVAESLRLQNFNGAGGVTVPIWKRERRGFYCSPRANLHRW